MTGICFYYENYEIDVWSGKKFDAWNYACKLAGDVDKAIVINRTDQNITSFNKSMQWNSVSSIEEAESLMSGNLMYLVCPWNTGEHTSIYESDHNIDWYIFGPASGWADHVQNGYYVPQAGEGATHSVHIATVVMLNRYKKLGSN